MKVTMKQYGNAIQVATLELNKAQLAEYQELQKNDDLDGTQDAWEYLYDLMYAQDFKITEFDTYDSELDWE